MRSKLSRILAGLMSVLMIVTSVPATTFATEADNAVAVEAETVSQAETEAVETVVSSVEETVAEVETVTETEYATDETETTEATTVESTEEIELQEGEVELTFNVTGHKKFSITTSILPFDNPDYDSFTESYDLTANEDGVATISVASGLYVAICGDSLEDTMGEPLAGNVSCTDGDRYYNLFSDYIFTYSTLMFDLGQVTDDKTYDFAYGPSEEDLHKVVISDDSESDMGGVSYFTIMYSSNGFDDDVDSVTGLASRGTMQVYPNEDNEFVFWIPDGYDWVIDKSGLEWFDINYGMILDEAGNMILKPQAEEYVSIKTSESYKNIYGFDNEDGNYHVVHNFGKITKDESYSFINRSNLTVKFNSRYRFVYYTSPDGVNYTTPRYTTSSDGYQVGNVTQGYDLVITEIYDEVTGTYIYPFECSLVFSAGEKVLNANSPEIISITEYDDTVRKSHAYNLGIIDSNEIIGVTETNKKVALYGKNVIVGYDVEYISGIEMFQMGVYDKTPGNIRYDGKSDIVFKMNNVYGEKAVDARVLYCVGSYEYESLSGKYNSLVDEGLSGIVDTISPDEDGKYTLAEETIREVLNQCNEDGKNVLFFQIWPDVPYVYANMTGYPSGEFSADLLISKNPFDVTSSDQYGKCHFTDKFFENGTTSVRIPQNYYVGVGNIVESESGAFSYPVSNESIAMPKFVKNKDIVDLGIPKTFGDEDVEGGLYFDIYFDEAADAIYPYKVAQYNDGGYVPNGRIKEIDYITSRDGKTWYEHSIENTEDAYFTIHCKVGSYLAITGIKCDGYNIDDVRFDNESLTATEITDASGKKWTAYSLGRRIGNGPNNGHIEIDTSYIDPMNISLPEGWMVNSYVDGIVEPETGKYILTGGVDTQIIFYYNPEIITGPASVIGARVKGAYITRDESGAIIKEEYTDYYRLTKNTNGDFELPYELIKTIKADSDKYDTLVIEPIIYDSTKSYITIEAEDIESIDIVYSTEAPRNGKYGDDAKRVTLTPDTDGKFYTELPKESYFAIEKASVVDGKKVKSVIVNESEREINPYGDYSLVADIGCMPSYDVQIKIECEEGKDYKSYNVFSFTGATKTLKDIEDQLPAGYKWADDTVAVSTLGSSPKLIKIVKTSGEDDNSYANVIPYSVAVVLADDVTGGELGTKLEKGKAVTVNPVISTGGYAEEYAAAGFGCSFSITSASKNATAGIGWNGMKCVITGIAPGKDTITVKYDCTKNGTVLATYTKTYNVEVVDTAKKGSADIKYSLVTRDADGKETAVVAADGVYTVSASDKLYIKNETAAYDSTGKINTLKYVSSDTATAKVGRAADAYTEIVLGTPGYVIITATAADTLATSSDITIKVEAAKNGADKIYDATNVVLNEYAVTLNTNCTDISGSVEVITPSGELVTAVAAVNADGSANSNYAVSVSNNIVKITGNKQSKAGKIYLKVTLNDAKASTVVIKNPVNVAVKNKIPAVNIKQTEKLSTYNSGSIASIIISVPGESITGVAYNSDSKYAISVMSEDYGASSISGWVYLKETTAAADIKNTAITVKVSLAGYDKPVEKVIKVATSTAVTALTSTAGTVYKGRSNTLTTQITNKTSKETVCLAGATVRCDNANYTVSIDEEQNVIKIVPKTELDKGKSDKLDITVKAEEMRFEQTYKYTVKYVDASTMSLALGSKTLTMYKYDGDIKDTATTLLTLKGGVQSDILSKVSIVSGATDKTAADYAKLKVEGLYANGHYIVKATVADNSIKAGSYKYNFVISSADAGTKKDVSVALTVKIADATGSKAPSVKTTVKGKLDTVNRFQGAELVSKFTGVNTAGADISTELIGRDAHLFEIGEDGKLYIAMDASVVTKYKYQVAVKYTVKRDGLTFVVTSPVVNVVLSQSKPKVTASGITAFSSVKSDTKDVKLTLQNSLGEQVPIGKIVVVNSNKAFTFTTDAEAEMVSITHNPMLGKTKKGKSYKVTFQIYPLGYSDNEKPVTVSYTIKIAK